MLLTAIFLLSMSSLTLEILLTRFFSISQWNHLSFMVISIALFGFAAAGAFFNIAGFLKKDFQNHYMIKNRINECLILYAFFASSSFIVLNILPLDFFRLPIEYTQGLYLLITYILLIFPFFFAGLLLLLAYEILPQKSGLIYGASMSGSALGAFLPGILINRFSEGWIIIFSSAIPLFLAIISEIFSLCKKPWANKKANKKAMIRSFAYIIICLAIIVPASAVLIKENNLILSVKPSLYKSLSQILMFPDTSIKKTYTDLRGRIDLVKSPFIRYSPGLSLKYQEELPNQYAAFKDGDNQFVFYDITNAKKIDFARSTLSYAGYVACPNPEKALIIQVNGGIAIPCAISSRAANISIVQENPGIARLLKRHYSLPVFNQNPRGFLSASKERFDIIHIENWGYSIPGSGALNQDSFFTVEAFNSYLTHLSEKGIFIISRKLLLPPTDILRLFAAAFESLKLTGRKNPQDHIAIFGTWDSWTMLVSYSPIADVKSMLKFSNDLNFDIVYLKGISEKEANRFNVFERPYFSNEIRSLAAALQRGNEKEYFSKYPFDVSSQSDRRPFPDKLLKWSWLKQDYKIMGSRLYNLFLSGEVVVFTVFIEALVLSVILLFFPVFFIKRAKSKVNIYMLGYFFFIGSGFIFSELFFIKQWTIIFGDPSVSFSMVLSGILISSGLGGFFSQKLSSKSIKYVLILLIILTFLLFFLFNICLRYLIPCPKFLQYVLALIILMPPGFLMGIPFPMSMRYLFNNTGHNQAERAYAWTANGCASVLFSIASVMIAVSIGIHAIIAAAAFSYFLALITFAAVRYKN